MLFGFKQNKCKQEVYSKDETDTLLGGKSNELHNHDTKYISKDNVVIVNGLLTASEGTAEATFAFPEGFNSTNCVVLSFNAHHTSESSVLAYGYLEDSEAYVHGIVAHQITLNTDNTITVRIKNQVMSGSGAGTFEYKLVLMKLPEVDISGYEMGDINMDGQITQKDVDLASQYYLGTTAFSDKQFKLADMNNDGKISNLDIQAIRNKIESSN